MARTKIDVSLITPLSANLSAGSNKITGLANGTIAGDALAYGQALSGSSLTFSSTSGIIGTTTNNSAAAGSVGEYIESIVTSNVTGSTTLATMTDTGCSIALTAGDWDVIAFASILIEGTVGVYPVAAIPRFVITDNANAIVASGIGGIAYTGSANHLIPITIKTRISISGSTTYKTRFTAISNSGTPTYTALTAEVFTSGTSNLTLSARRVR